ncbi:MAG: hypothetical protein L3J98_04685 [Gammaproteobacteria bacterium]|nr:hypothetical protein [Gammaproteobacteria bacterium]MCF6259448.1 hypothetical protein [Gammaproteobacteria bacterium]
MRQYHSTPKYPHNFRPVALLLVLLGLSACATSDKMTDTTANDTTLQTVTQIPDTAQNDNTGTTTESTDIEPSATESAISEPEPSTQEPVTSRTETEPVSIDAPCKNSPYNKYEKQSLASIAKGLSATTAGTYGVGFRNLDEHKKWSDTHNALFSAVNQACTTLSKCAKQHPEDKTTECAKEAKQFDEWQNLAARFAEKAKQSETTQPPKICSFTANLDDAANCFHALADNIDNTCTTSDCKKTSNCWRGIGFLDGAINQAVSACAFVRTPLAECHGYVTATQRRKDKFERCVQMQKGLNTRIIPVL